MCLIVDELFLFASSSFLGGGFLMILDPFGFVNLSGFLFRVFDGEFDPGSGRTLAACLTHASRTVTEELAPPDQWRTGE